MKNLKSLKGLKSLTRNEQKSISGGLCYEPAFEGSHFEVPVSLGCGGVQQLDACITGFDVNDPGAGCLAGQFCIETLQGNRCK